MSDSVARTDDKGTAAYAPPAVRGLGSFAELTLGKKAHVPDQLGGANASPPGWS